MKKAFQVGDRVAVYWHDGRFTGRIVRVSNEGSTGYRYFVEFDSGKLRWAHRKQCRRLVKKKRRSVWIHVLDIPNPNSWNVSACALKGAPEHDHIEFREVKRK